MAIYKLFDINTATSLKPWGAREEQAIKDIIDTLVTDTIDGTKLVGGHLHGKLYASDSVAAIDASTSTSLTLNMRDDIATGLIIKNRNGDNIITVNSSTTAPAVTFNCALDINDNIAFDTNYLNYDGSDSNGISFDASNYTIVTGRLGIGITPVANLHVNGNSAFEDVMDINANMVIAGSRISSDNATDEGIYFNGNNTLSVNNTATTWGDARISMYVIDNTTYNTGVGGGISFIGKYNSSDATTDLANIKGVKKNASDGDYSGQLHFQTREYGGTPATPATRLMIDDAGEIFMYDLTGSTGENDLRYNVSTGEVFYDTSALKYKENIRSNPDTKWIYDVPVVIYDRKDKSRNNEIGIIADDLQKIKPEYCSYNKNGEVESFNKSDLVPVLIAELQKHENRIKHLECLCLSRG